MVLLHTRQWRWLRGLLLILWAGLVGLPPATHAGFSADNSLAPLNNAALYQAAVANMKALKSHRFVFIEQPRDPPPGIDSSLTITGDIQLGAGGSRFWISYDLISGSTDADSETFALHNWSETREIRILGETMYAYSGWVAPTWQEVRFGDLNNATFIVLLYGAIWQWPFSAKADQPTMVEGLVDGALWRDGSPREELIDGIATRHLVAEIVRPTMPPGMTEYPPTEASPWLDRVHTIDFWITTDGAPTIRRIRTEVHAGRPFFAPVPGREIPYTLTWTWSQLNADFGLVPNPLTAPAQEPTPPAPAARPTGESPTPAPVPPPAATPGMPRTGSETGWAAVLLLAIAGAVTLGIGQLLRHRNAGRYLR